MKTLRLNKLFLAAAGVAACVILARGSLVRFDLPPETARLKTGPGVELAAGQCLLCHSADYISTQPRLTKAQWSATVKKMREKFGAPIPADKVDAIAEYLATAYGPETASRVSK